MQNELQRYPWLLLHHPSPLLSVMLESKCLILEQNIPLFGSFEPPLTQHETLTRTERAAWLHIPTMRLHKKHQLSRTGRLFLKRLSMQLLCPVLLSSVCIGRGGCSVVSVAVELQGRWYMLTQLVGFWLQELCVRRAKSWMEVIMCNLPICLHVIPKPWIINFIQVTIS